MDQRIYAAIRDLDPAHGALAARLSTSWGENLFPCDVMALAVLHRSLDILSGFLATSQRRYYSSSVCLLRVQLDSVARFNGIIYSPDPHDLAGRVFAGESLRDIKASDGNKMTDKYLVKKLSAIHAGIEEAYDLACAHIHLSDQHIHALLRRSVDAGDRRRVLSMGACADHLDEHVHNNLANAFYAVTCGVMNTVEQFAAIRSDHHLECQPEKRFLTPI